MAASGRIRTDLALEATERFREIHRNIRGVEIHENYDREKDIRTTVVKILTENGYMNRVTEVIAVDLKDEVGGLNTVLQVLGNCNVNLDYIYTSYHRGNALPIMILQTDDVFVTENVLSNNGFRVLNSLEG